MNDQNRHEYLLSELGRREEALAAAQEATEHYRQLAAARPGRGEANWTDAISCLAHWEALSMLYTGIESHHTVPARLGAADGAIRAAQALYGRLQASGVYFEPATGPDHLVSWRDAITTFRQEASV